MKQVIEKFIQWVEKKTDKTMPAEMIQKYVVDRYMYLSYQFTHGRDAENENALRDLNHLHEKMVSLGWIKAPKNPFKLVRTNNEISREELSQWKIGLKDDRVIHSGVVMVGTGKYLDHLADLEGEAPSDFIRHNLETLVRHVETQRGGALRYFNRRMKEEKRWFERLDIVLLLIRSSLRLKDVRFLNAALKCTEAYYGYFKFKLPGPLLIRYLITLVEQEFALKELTKK
jgi:hypothetical protein